MDREHTDSKPNKYRKKPVVVEAMRWSGNVADVDALRAFVGDSLRTHAEAWDTEVYIQTLEGEMHATPGDYIIKGLQGEYYPCKPDIFEATYEVVEE